jgi:ADP-heptose:LPS heptosyltransferase
VARHFLQRGYAVVVVGAPREREVGANIARLAPGLVDLTGETSISELAALIARAAICIAHDSGPMHLAVALDRPVVGVFGPSDTVWAGPYHRENAVVRAALPCSPCYLRRLERCPNGHACMNDLPARALIERMEGVLGAALAPA